MKRKERTHVKIYEQHRMQRNRSVTRHIVVWTPTPNDRQRKTFTSRVDAEAEADRIEEEMQFGAHALAKRSAQEIVAFNLICSRFPGVTLPEIGNFYAAHHDAVIKSTETIASAVEEFLAIKLAKPNLSIRHKQTLRSHLNRFAVRFGTLHLNELRPQEIDAYLDHEIGGTGKTRLQNLVSIRNFFHWCRDKRNLLPHNAPTAADQAERPLVVQHEHEVYTPEEMTRILAFTPDCMVIFIVLGAFASIRAEERSHLLWKHWRIGEEKLVIESRSAKTKVRRSIDVMPNLSEWLAAFRGEPEEPMVPARKVYWRTGQIAAASGVPWKPNALRAGFASYHLELFDNAALTAKNDGHSVVELLTTYKSIENVTKATAQAMFAITPTSVLEHAEKRGLPEPDWASKILEKSSCIGTIPRLSEPHKQGHTATRKLYGQ